MPNIHYDLTARDHFVQRLVTEDDTLVSEDDTLVSEDDTLYVSE